MMSSIFGQSHLRAPNSYIFDINQPLTVKGIKIPVKKAFDAWANQEYLYTSGSPTILPTGTESVGIYWEDQPGLIRNVSLEGTRETAKIKVEIDRSKGEGNAVVNYKINGTIYWSWHVWITDDPGLSDYARVHGTTNYKDRNINGVVDSLKFMDRYIGATSSEFLGNQWNKSGGLLYQYGRKDPLPKFIDKDLSYYEIEGEVGVRRHVYFANQVGYSNPILAFIRSVDNSGVDKVNQFVQQSVNNPLQPIVSPQDPITLLIANEPWYSNLEFKFGTTTHDLWADNLMGRSANDLSSPSFNNARMKLKSVYDPCPNGWRVPSFLRQQNEKYAGYSPFGNSAFNQYPTDGSPNFVDDLYDPNVTSISANQIKFYPSLGVDFRNSTNRLLGKFPLSGKYNYYANKPVPLSFYFQDIQAELTVHSAVMSIDGDPKSFVIINDIARLEKNNGLGEFLADSHGTAAKGGSPVKCVKDFNYQLTNIAGTTVPNYDFPTEYFSDTSVVDLQEGLNLPNSYVVPLSNTTFEFPILKAFSMYNQYLTDHQQITGNLRANILWMSSPNLISNIVLTQCNDDPRKYVELTLPGNQVGNALISLENATSGEVYWSWHIWIPDGNPTDSATGYNYITETERPMVNTVGYTNSGAPPLNTTFMDRNLGALYAFPSAITSGSTDPLLIDQAKKSGGLFYQWGRKDPLNSYNYAGNAGTFSLYQPVIEFSTSSPNYGNVLSTSVLNSQASISNQASSVFTQAISKDEKIQTMLKLSANNPTSLLVEDTGEDWLYKVGGIFTERWGHADTKSVFDPCPEGWRVPDFSFLNHVSLRNNYSLTNQDTEARGTSPWYFANGGSTTLFNFNNTINSTITDANTINEIKTSFQGIPQSIPYHVTNVYGGTKVMNSGNVFGWKFSGNTNGYIIGDYPATGILNQSGNTLLNGTDLTALWTAAPEIFQKGEAKAFWINNDNMSTGSILDFTTDKSQSFKPQIAMNVRCVKQNDIYRGDNGTIEVPPVKCTSTMGVQTATKNEIDVFPNPFTDTLHISSKKDLNYEFYDISGKLISSGKTVQQKISLQNLPKGVYLLKLMDHEKKIQISKKVIKK